MRPGRATRRECDRWCGRFLGPDRLYPVRRHWRRRSTRRRSRRDPQRCTLGRADRKSSPSMPHGVTTAQFDTPIAKAGLFGLGVLIATKPPAGRRPVPPDRPPSRRGCGCERRAFGVGQDRRSSAAWRRRAGRSALRRLPDHRMRCSAILASPVAGGNPTPRARGGKRRCPPPNPGSAAWLRRPLPLQPYLHPHRQPNNAGFNYTGQLPTSPNNLSFPVVCSAAGDRCAGLRFCRDTLRLECNPRADY